jgi:hypothetical protein
MYFHGVMKYMILACLFVTTLITQAELSFEHSLQELKADLEAKTVTSDYKFTNTGDETVTIMTADGGCSCMKVEIAEGKLTYAPGETGILRATFEIGSFQGTVDRAIHVRMKDDPVEKPSYMVALRIHVPVIISLTPKTLRWDIGEENTPKNIRVDMDYKNPIHITFLSSSNPDFTAELVTITEGKTYDVKVTPKNVDDAGITIIKMMTDVDIERHRLQQGFATVRKPPAQ